MLHLKNEWPNIYHKARHYMAEGHETTNSVEHITLKRNWQVMAITSPHSHNKTGASIENIVFDSDFFLMYDVETLNLSDENLEGSHDFLTGLWFKQLV